MIHMTREEGGGKTKDRLEDVYADGGGRDMTGVRMKRHKIIEEAKATAVMNKSPFFYSLRG